jgi:hypothetical protein
MVDHTAHEFHDPALVFPGHISVIVHVAETGSYGLHCGDCGWFGGRFFGRWAETRMSKAWAEHATFVIRGGVIEHAHPMCWPAGICLCPRCRSGVGVLHW